MRVTFHTSVKYQISQSISFVLGESDYQHIRHFLLSPPGVWFKGAKAMAGPRSFEAEVETGESESGRTILAEIAGPVSNHFVVYNGLGC